MDTNKLPGALKVAVLIHSMGEKVSKDIMDRMGPAERELVQQHLSQMGSISPEVVEKISQEFAMLADKIKQRKSKEIPLPYPDKMSQQGAPNSAQKPSQEPASDEPDPDSEEELVETPGLDALHAIEPEQLVEMIKDEHPQTIAVIIVHLKPEAGIVVLSLLPDDIKVEVAMRIAKLDKVLSGMVVEIGHVFEEIMKKKKTSAMHKTGGVSHLAELLNMADGTAGEQLLTEIEEVNPDLAAQIKMMMFVFEDLVLVDDKGMQKVLRRVETSKLSLALKGASEEVKRKIFKNMSERAGEMLREEIESIGAVRMRDVEEAQQTITRIIQELEAKSEIIISGRKGGDYIA
jgi:flagellar motor switch protein FliG